MSLKVFDTNVDALHHEEEIWLQYKRISRMIQHSSRVFKFLIVFHAHRYFIFNLDEAVLRLSEENDVEFRADAALTRSSNNLSHAA